MVCVVRDSAWAVSHLSPALLCRHRVECGVTNAAFLSSRKRSPRTADGGTDRRPQHKCVRTYGRTRTGLGFSQEKTEQNRSVLGHAGCRRLARARRRTELGGFWKGAAGCHPCQLTHCRRSETSPRRLDGKP